MRYADCHPDRKHKGSGLCNPCWQRDWRAKHPGQTWQQRNPEESRQYHKAWYQAHRDKILERNRVRRVAGLYYERNRRWWLKNQYDMTLDDFRDHLVGQAGRCLICLRVPTKDLVPDHDHATGKVRGLLCQTCNKGIGHFADDGDRLRSAARYVERAS